jgi:hypothetical protein
MRLSPDGQRLALTINESGIASIAVYDIKTTETTRITTRPGEYTGLTWISPAHLAFGGATGLGWVPAMELADPAPLMTARTAQTPWSTDPGGHRLAYYERSAESGFDLWTVPILHSKTRLALGRPEPFLQTRAFEVYPSFSPDGRWMAYASNESGSFEIYVRQFPDDGTKVRVSKSGGVVPYWSSNRRELMYRTDVNRVMVVSYTTAGTSFAATEPRFWSPHTLADTGVLPNFAVEPFGDRILALMPTPPKDPQSTNHVTVILNFVDEVRRRASSR